MDIEEEFQQNCFGSFASSPGPSKNAAKQHAAAKSPARPSAAKPAATKPVAHKQSPAKPAGKAASTASKPSLARAPAKSPAVAKVSQPQHVTTVSDDEDDDGDDEDMPGLVSDNNVSDEEDDYTSDESEAPPSLISEDDSEDDTQQESFAASKHRPAAAFGKPMESTARDSGSARVPTKGNKQAPADSKVEGKQAPPAASTEGKAATSAAAAEPMFRPVSRGFLAQQTGSVEAKPGQADSTSDAVEDAIRLGLKEAASGTPFSFDKAVGGGSKASSAASSSKAGTGSKADDSVPASQQPVYPFPQASLGLTPFPVLCSLNHSYHKKPTVIVGIPALGRHLAVEVAVSVLHKLGYLHAAWLESVHSTLNTCIVASKYFQLAAYPLPPSPPPPWGCCCIVLQHQQADFRSC